MLLLDTLNYLLFLYTLNYPLCKFVSGLFLLTQLKPKEKHVHRERHFGGEHGEDIKPATEVDSAVSQHVYRKVSAVHILSALPRSEKGFGYSAPHVL